MNRDSDQWTRTTRMKSIRFQLTTDVLFCTISHCFSFVSAGTGEWLPSDYCSTQHKHSAQNAAAKKKKTLLFQFYYCLWNKWFFMCGADFLPYIHSVRHCLQLHSVASRAQWTRQVNGRILNARERITPTRINSSCTTAVAVGVCGGRFAVGGKKETGRYKWEKHTNN